MKYCCILHGLVIVMKLDEEVPVFNSVFVSSFSASFDHHPLAWISVCFITKIEKYHDFRTILYRISFIMFILFVVHCVVNSNMFRDPL